MTFEYVKVNHDKVVHETIEDEVIIINLDTGTYYSLLDTGTAVWRGLEQGASRQSIVTALANHYGVARGTVTEAVDSLIEELISEEIVVPASDGVTEFALNGQSSGQPFTPPTLARHTNMSDLLLLDPIHDVDERGWPHKRDA